MALKWPGIVPVVRRIPGRRARICQLDGSGLCLAAFIRAAGLEYGFFFHSNSSEPNRGVRLSDSRSWISASFQVLPLSMDTSICGLRPARHAKPLIS